MYRSDMADRLPYSRAKPRAEARSAALAYARRRSRRWLRGRRRTGSPRLGERPLRRADARGARGSGMRAKSVGLAQAAQPQGLGEPVDTDLTSEHRRLDGVVFSVSPRQGDEQRVQHRRCDALLRGGAAVAAYVDEQPARALLGQVRRHLDRLEAGPRRGRAASWHLRQLLRERSRLDDRGAPAVGLAQASAQDSVSQSLG